MKPDLKNMTGEQLFEHYLVSNGRGGLYDLLPEIYISFGNREKTYSFLEDFHKEPKKIFVVKNSKIPKGGKFICEITTGSVYVKPK